MKTKRRFLPIALIFIMSLTMFADITTYEVSANAHGSINLRDGNATWDSGGYRPNSVHSGEQSDTHARDVDPAVERAWINNNIERAGKYPRSIYNPNRGNRLGYDVYQGNTNHTYKQSWRITRSGGEDFFTFDGWAVNNGYYHHDNHNQATYIVAENANNTSDFHIYKARLTNLNAGKDLEYNKQSNTGPISNKCPNTGDGAFMRYNDECNMEYKWVGFRAYIPLNDLFESGNEEYDLYLIKSVSGRDNNENVNKLVYDTLRMPYENEGVSWNNGELSLSSGTDLSRLRMITSDVIRQTTPRGTGSGWNLGWFTEREFYDFRSQNESSGVTAWFGVRSHHDNNNTRYANSMYWQITGDQARLSWEQSTADVRVRHINENTDSVLRTDWHRDLNIGERHTFHPESRGTWTDNDGNPFVPIDDSRTITLNGNTTIDFHYKASIPDPTDSHEMDGSTEGLAEGEFSWELNKQDDDGESRIDIRNNPEITGNHYAIRDVSYETHASGVFRETGDSPQHLYDNDPNKLKNSEIDYDFSYDYTNHYWSNYECIDSLGNDCFEWEFVNHTPDWGEEETAEWSSTLSVDHNYGETFEFHEGDSNDLSMVVSRVTEIDGNTNAMTDHVYDEELTVDRKDTALDSQTWKEILETVEYSSELNNDLYVIDGNRYYYPNDLDDNLRSKYENTTAYAFGDYAIPLRIDELGKDEVTFKTEDNFFMTQKTGFLFSVPSDETSEARINIFARDQYEDYTGNTYADTVLTDVDDGSRYYINIDLEGEQEPNTEYDDHVVLGRMGLNDVTVQLMQTLEFDQYLFGHVPCI